MVAALLEDVEPRVHVGRARRVVVVDGRREVGRGADMPAVAVEIERIRAVRVAAAGDRKPVAQEADEGRVVEDVKSPSKW